jgi:hypothetical protein
MDTGGLNMNAWSVEVTPLNDARPHIASEYCPCLPSIDDGVLIHNAFDGRDRQERYDAMCDCQDKHPSPVDCRQLGDLLLKDSDGNTLTFCSRVTVNDDRISFDVCRIDGGEGTYTVTVQVQEQ